MERSKHLSHNQNKENTNAFTIALPPSKLAALRMAEKVPSGSESPAQADSPKYDEPNAASTACTVTILFCKLDLMDSMDQLTHHP
ncbi:hypothetical protein PGT21_017155 [Puccinia graminis f. sp. tritici]|uniref:Uncharacterized protein n=1 Tax=Puccinia graminis f. sp. tritici TaxID=56615 RepID=A0A5B0NCL8_PUCGR|nr:hypothetical protein PGT21_017155 [Puccinia graminis f. sp. tritici]KAA1136129.1 hypothetical protein PGTUg99_032419 [Puccinia graminis f. sp. tritici]